MVEVPVTPDVVDFLVLIYKRTKQQALKWELVDESSLRADLGDGYTAVLTEVPDLDESTPDPDQELSLVFRDTVLLKLNRNLVTTTHLRHAGINDFEFSYHFFRALWGAAVLSGTDFADHLKAVTNKLRRMEGPGKR